MERTKAFLQERLAALIAEARSTRRPIPDGELVPLCPEPLVRDLKGRPGDSRECGECFGRTITEAESREHLLGDILRELGVDVAAVCPHRLTEKRGI
jgi:hypothetical protein